MRPFRVYVDTSVLGGYFDPEFAEWSRSLIQDFRLGRLKPVLSEVVATEIEPAPSHVREIHAELVRLPAEIVDVTVEAVDLVDQYARRGVLGERYRNDMLHIAVATIARVDVLVSWNFRHIVRLDKIESFNAVNRERGLGTLNIYSPREVTFHGED